ncbi:hypothetical protein [Dinghuibacter silviterrae]|uniref:Uncharacterized protein n=1 Tax=Dinghuibacter silviterrae TaxID=1539049 RepID=A0A4R8DJB6_9BACT|nr:hypothetical protein [Dinghuibacter silviterrae]TDW97414.1 hypothetical protein EDB95_5263 [Dinghuibacter silviterrae]
MRPLILCLLLAGWACHSGPSTQKRYDSTTMTPGGKDSLSNGAPQDVDSLEAQIHAPDTVFEDGSRPTSWAAAGFNNPERFKRFLMLFKDWVKKDQVDSITDHVRFPLRAAGSPAWFKERYTHLFTPALKTAIFRQRLDRVFRNGQGAMIGRGEVWFQEIRGRYYVTAIN